MSITCRIIPGTAVVPQMPARIKRGFTRTLIPEEQPKPLTQYQVQNSKWFRVETLNPKP